MAYIYRHIRLDKNKPFYVGIGSDNDYKRAHNKHKRTTFWKNIINKTPYEVEILLDGLTWEQACEKEIEFISLYGRADLNKGTLVNMTDGGEGQYGRKISEETRIKMCKPKSENAKQNLKISHKNRDYSYLKGKAGCKAGVNKSKGHIQNLLKAKKGISRGYCQWLVNNEKRSNKIKLSKLGKPSLKKIALFQLDKNLNIVNEFQSITDAINKTKIKGVGNALTGLAKTAGGYIWKYK
jgi:hypothetical protein